MTAAARRDTTAAPRREARPPQLEIGAMTVRGCGLSPAAGQSLAAAVAEVLAHQLAGRTARIGGMTIRMPASVLAVGGAIDRAALRRAVGHAERDRDA